MKRFAGIKWSIIYIQIAFYHDILPTPGKAKAKAMPGRLYIANPKAWQKPKPKPGRLVL